MSSSQAKSCTWVGGVIAFASLGPMISQPVGEHGVFCIAWVGKAKTPLKVRNLAGEVRTS